MSPEWVCFAGEEMVSHIPCIGAEDGDQECKVW